MFITQDIVAIEAENHQKTGLADFSLDEILNLCQLSTNILDSLTIFERNAMIAFNGFFFKEQLLEELFKTSFHLQFLFQEKIDSIQFNHEIFRSLEASLIDDELC